MQQLKAVYYCKNRKEKLYISNADITWINMLGLYLFVLKLPENGTSVTKHEGG
jgi:hypothetical protein